MKNRNAAGQETDGAEKKEKSEGKRGKGMKRENRLIGRLIKNSYNNVFSFTTLPTFTPLFM